VFPITMHCRRSGIGVAEDVSPRLTLRERKKVCRRLTSAATRYSAFPFHALIAKSGIEPYPLCSGSPACASFGKLMQPYAVAREYFGIKRA
jgi:hypothetical protein